MREIISVHPRHFPVGVEKDLDALLLCIDLIASSGL